MTATATRATDFDQLSRMEEAKEFARQCAEPGDIANIRRRLAEVSKAEEDLAAMRAASAKHREAQSNAEANLAAAISPLQQEIEAPDTTTERRIKLRMQIDSLEAAFAEETNERRRLIAAAEKLEAPLAVRASARQLVETAARRSPLTGEEENELWALERAINKFEAFISPFPREAEAQQITLNNVRDKKKRGFYVFPGEEHEAEQNAKRAGMVHGKLAKLLGILNAERNAIHERRVARLYAE